MAVGCTEPRRACIGWRGIARRLFWHDTDGGSHERFSRRISLIGVVITLLVLMMVAGTKGPGDASTGPVQNRKVFGNLGAAGRLGRLLHIPARKKRTSGAAVLGLATRKARGGIVVEGNQWLKRSIRTSDPDR